jgi:hypothetical protein
MITPMGALVSELKAGPLGTLVNGRIRGGRPRGAVIAADGTVTDAGDARGPGDYIKFVVLVHLGHSRVKGKAPVQTVRIGYRTYGETPEQASVVALALSEAVHNIGPRIRGGTLIFRTYDDTGGEAGEDPGTKQPFEDGVIEVFAATQAVA